ncbi:glycosyltransferase [Parendozoicomonas sp. Alg238-R29]|uniref:glycosyltransferase family 2 protein n=1 Tax=Parendozoicomonas sp. Alg238-R29 TaxID=2993446 RepID=UPI00248D96C4|nr:glycosyltransferase [Parendozoicomonas sp. Alg238-R29]
MSCPEVSVILPVHNGACYLRESLESVLRQTIDDIEIIVVNDGSTDESGTILSEFLRLDRRIKVVSLNKVGIVGALNKALDLCVGKYIARMDADDICSPYRFEKQKKFLEDNELDVCGSQIELFGASKGIKNFPVTHNELFVNLLTYGKSIAHPTVFARAEVFECFQYSNDFPNAEDYALWLQIVTESGFRIGNFPEPLLKYRVHDMQISREKKNSQRQSTNIAFEYYLGKACPVMNTLELMANTRVAKQRNAEDNAIYVNHLSFLVKLREYLSSKNVDLKYYDSAIVRMCKRGVNHRGFPLNRYFSLLTGGVPTYERMILKLKNAF